MSEHRRKFIGLSLDELVLINNALNEITNGADAIDEWEFQTRVGLPRQTAEALLKRIGNEVDRWDEQ